MTKHFDNVKHYLKHILPILPAIALAIFIIEYGVNVPVYDQWGAPFNILDLASRGELSFQTLINISQANESRLFFPNLLFLGLAKLTHWNTKVEMMTSWLFGVFILANLYILTNLTLKELTSWQRSLVLLVMSLLVFSPVQFENWLWGIQLITFIPILCISSCISVCYAKLKTWQKFCLCGLLCSISTFSYANGMLSWIIVYPILATSKTWNLRSLLNRYWLLGSWPLLAIMNLGLYLYNYQRPDLHPSFQHSLGHPVQAIQYFLAFVGAPFGLNQSLTVCIFLGFLLLSMFAYCNWILYRLLVNQKIYLYKFLGWQLLGAYTLLSAALTTFGRLGFGVEQAMSPRYVTFSTYLVISLVGLLSTLFAHRKDIFKLAECRFLKSQKYPVLCISAIFTLLYMNVYTYSVQQMATVELDRLNGKGCLIFISQIPEETCLNSKIFPFLKFERFGGLDYLLSRVVALNEIGYLSPALVNTNILQALEGDPERGSTQDTLAYGNFEKLEQQDDDTYLARGWASLPDRKSPADAIVLAYRDPSSDQDIGFAITEKRGERRDVVEHFKRSRYQYSGWERSFATSLIPESACEISAWALDANRAAVFPIAQVHNLCGGDS